ncbi:hypothetical protein CSUB01_00025 [Colletotrichum sublineola]|uniref:Uncharacterized protein n=1 Tax=Colletotrichum sublineola TaxID=1173701 RepID=A0A066XTZ0_COLSU|nr:hypothetical protein CSUB01_00025 [Colletotrichum sublineola]
MQFLGRCIQPVKTGKARQGKHCTAPRQTDRRLLVISRRQPATFIDKNTTHQRQLDRPSRHPETHPHSLSNHRPPLRPLPLPLAAQGNIDITSPDSIGRLEPIVVSFSARPATSQTKRPRSLPVTDIGASSVSPSPVECNLHLDPAAVGIDKLHDPFRPNAASPIFAFKSPSLTTHSLTHSLTACRLAISPRLPAR